MSREKRRRRWNLIGEKVIDDKTTGYIEIYLKDGNPLHAKSICKDLIAVNFEQERSKQDAEAPQG